jgi:RNA dependent RNA polymerase
MRDNHTNTFDRDVLKNRLPVPANDCRYIFGCALESKLQEGQCFIRYQVLDERGKRKEKLEYQTVVGPVVVTKNPW